MEKDYCECPEKIIILTEFSCKQDYYIAAVYSKRDKTQDKTCIYCYRQMNETMYIYCLMCRDIQIRSNILDQQYEIWCGSESYSVYLSLTCGLSFKKRILLLRDI
uniref:Uncharacterized protein n=1 Tax=Coccidioides posadasii RMSCC 3488 TaxID=454284 RepID=A0A0J6FQ65_COCPO|nr:hypothetical protein CPAG_07426 [Coccidioides posadasii RMSCC 3488]